MKKHLIALILILATVVSAIGQSFYNYKRNRVLIGSIGTGVSSYYGDLNDPGDLIDTKLNLNIGLQYPLNTRIAVRSEVTWFQLSGDDAQSEANGRRKRNLSFVSSNFELNAVGVINAFESRLRYYQRPTVNVYAFAGVGLLYFNPKGELDGKKYALQPIQTEGVKYSRMTFVIPIGGGVKYKVGPFFNVGIEGTYRKTFTDYLDDVSTTFVDNSSFENQIHAKLADRRWEINPNSGPFEAGHKRGNPDDKDGYFILNLKIEYYLPPGLINFGPKNRRPVKRNKRPRGR